VTVDSTTRPSAADSRVRVNDVAVKVATVNGTGSSSMNTLLLRAIFRMGIPVSGKNLFPSNIQGMPTWYEIRANADGHTSRAPTYDVVVALNGQTYAEDVADVTPGGYVVHDSTWPLPDSVLRPDVTFLGVPFTTLVQSSASSSRERILLTNTCYTGVLVALLDIDLDVVRGLLDETFAKKARLREANQDALRVGYDYAREHLGAPLPVRLASLGEPTGKILVDGNTATALGCLYAGATVAAWYPITPSTSVMDSFTALCRQYRTSAGPDGEQRNDYLVLQAEDELAAIGMVIGASWNGARAFTATSGPGISLMGELLGLAYYTEIPAVVVDVQRAGPSTGMPTRTQQADLLACAYASHGDTKHLLLFPAHPGECFEFAVQAFDLAERFQTPVMLVSDLDIGMNDWVVDELVWDDAFVPDRGRVLGPEELAALPRFSRYGDEDADFVAARTLPGIDPRGAYFVRGSGHDEHAAYTERADAYQKVVDRLARKHAAAAAHLPAPVVERQEGATLGVVSIGSCDLAVREALELLADRGVRLDYLRVRGFPFPPEVRAFLDEHDRCFVVEQNRDAQLRTLLTAETGADATRLVPVLSYGGLPISAQHVVDAIARELED
jgi:2-oxoglutarate/2-oxoacid ferredoxin oxidoreductase subunit alpha